MSVEIPIVNAGYLNVQGLQIAWTGNAALTVQVGQARDSSNTNDIILSAIATMNAASVGLNGLDTGTLAESTVYGLYVVGDSTQNNPSGIILSANQTSPLLPVNYDMYRKIGYIATDSSSHFLLGYWQGNSNERKFRYDAPQATAVTAGNATSYTAVDLSALAPSVVTNLLVDIAFAFTPAAASHTLKLQPVNATGDAVTITGQVASVVVSDNVELFAQIATAKAEINYKVANGSDAVALNVAGYDYSI